MKPHYYFIIVPIFLAAGYLSLVRLDNTVFWDDEAETGIVARNFLKFGRLTGWDGRNLLAYRNGGILDENLRPRNSPLGYLVAAASFQLLGISTWAGRFPFVLAGLASLLLLALILRMDYGADSVLWIYGTAAMAFSVAFLLCIRQCRYYSITMLFSLLTFLNYRQCLQTGRLIWFVFLSIAATLLFYSNFLLCGAFLMTLTLVHLMFQGRQLRKDGWKFCLAISLFAISVAPYALYYRIWHRPDIPVSAEAWYVQKLTLIWWNLHGLNIFGYLPWTVEIGLVYFIIRYNKKYKNFSTILQWCVLSFGYTVAISLISPQRPEITFAADARYLIPTIPFWAGLVGVFIWFIHRHKKVGAVAVLTLIIATNLLSIAPRGWNFQWLLPAYINEIHHDYPTAYGEVVQFLQKNAKQDETVFTYPEFANYPVMFYVGDKVKICCTLDMKSVVPLDKIRSLDVPLLIEENFPDWFIVFGLRPYAKELLVSFSKPHLRQGQLVKFRYEFVRVLNVYCENTTRPELLYHQFSPKTDFDREKGSVFVLRRFDN